MYSQPVSMRLANQESTPGGANVVLPCVVPYALAPRAQLVPGTQTRLGGCSADSIKSAAVISHNALKIVTACTASATRCIVALRNHATLDLRRAARPGAICVSRSDGGLTASGVLSAHTDEIRLLS